MRPSKKDLEIMTSQELRSKYGLQYNVISFLRAEAGIVKIKKYRERPKSLTDDELRELTLIQLSAKYSVPIPYLRQWRKKAGIIVRQGGSSKLKCPIVLNPKKYRPLFDLLTEAQIARAFELSRERVRQLKAML